MPDKELSFLILGDIIGSPGMRAVISSLGKLKTLYRPHCIIANAENAHKGFGITSEVVQLLQHNDVDAITTGNHVWRQEGVAELLDREENVLRPVNYPAICAGKGWCLLEVQRAKVMIINAQGRKLMTAIDCPFRTIQSTVKNHGGQADIIIVDFHAEDVMEKQALGHYLDGKVGLLYGTHTHTQTRDARIQPQGTGFCTDIGACIPRNSVIGFNAQASIDGMITNVPYPFIVEENTAIIHGLFVTIDSATGHCTTIQTIRYESTV